MSLCVENIPLYSTFFSLSPISKLITSNSMFLCCTSGKSASKYEEECGDVSLARETPQYLSCSASRSSICQNISIYKVQNPKQQLVMFLWLETLLYISYLFCPPSIYQNSVESQRIIFLSSRDQISTLRTISRSNLISNILSKDILSIFFSKP